jgi:hypothetical protein
MRGGFIVAAMVVALTGASTGAHAEDWCGYAAKDHSVIECGYTSNVECESATGKGGTCFIDPDYARDERPVTPTHSGSLPVGRG